MPHSLPAWHPDRLAERLPFLRRRARLAAAVRAFFDSRGYLEVETRYAVPTPGEDVHLAAFATEQVSPTGERRQLWLHTSAEFAMKRLLTGRSGSIFQLNRVWRNNEGSDRHAAEFTMLEWYRPGATLDDLVAETFALLRAVLPPTVALGDGRPNDLGAFEALTVAEAFRRDVGVDVLATAGDADSLAREAGVALRPGETWEDLFFRLMLASVDPQLGRDRPTFLTHWPAAQAALARKSPADPRVAERFELFVCGLELANAFIELTDPVEQRARFEADRLLRRALYGDESWPMDEQLLAALEFGMPAAGGVAMGFDRLAMVAGGATRIDQVLWLPED